MTVGVWTIISPSGVRQDAGTEQISGHLVIQMTASGQLGREFHDQCEGDPRREPASGGWGA